MLVAPFLAACLGDFAEPPPYIPPANDGGNMAVGDAGTTDAEADATVVREFAVVATEPFGAPAKEGARVGVGHIPEGFAVAELAGAGILRTYFLGYDGSTSLGFSNDFSEVLLGGVDAVAPIFDAVIVDSNVYLTTSVGTSEVIVRRCTFAGACNDIFISGADRGTDLAFTSGAAGGNLLYLTNDDGAGIAVGNVTRDPFGGSVQTEALAGVETDALAVRTSPDGISQLAWLDVTEQAYVTARWRTGGFVSDPKICGGFAGARARIVPVGVTGDVLFLTGGQLVRSPCVDALTDQVGVDPGVADVDLLQVGDSINFVLAWRTVDDELFVAYLNAGSFELDAITSVGTVPNSDGIRLAISADESRVALVSWGDQNQAWILGLP